VPDLTSLDGASVSLSAEEVAAFGSALEGDLLTPDSSGYDEA
jgi:hypothetical protein